MPCNAAQSRDLFRSERSNLLYQPEATRHSFDAAAHRPTRSYATISRRLTFLDPERHSRDPHQEGASRPLAMRRLGQDPLHPVDRSRDPRRLEFHLTLDWQSQDRPALSPQIQNRVHHVASDNSTVRAELPATRIVLSNVIARLPILFLTELKLRRNTPSMRSRM